MDSSGKQYLFKRSFLRTLNDGVISPTRQSTGDCFLLSAINALSCSDSGFEILSDAFEYDIENNTAILHLATGDYTVSDTEFLRNCRHYSSGDLDVVLFELGFNKAYEDISTMYVETKYTDENGISRSQTSSSKLPDSIGSGGYPKDVIALLTGMQCERTFTDDTDKCNETLDKFADENSDMVVTASAVYDIIEEGVRYMTDITTGEQVKIGTPHAYSVKTADENTVTLVDPRNSSKQIVISRDEFLEKFYKIEYVDLNSPQDTTVGAVRNEDVENYPDIVTYCGEKTLMNASNITQIDSVSKNGLASTTYTIEYNDGTQTKTITVAGNKNGETEVTTTSGDTSETHTYIISQDGSVKKVE